MALSAGGEGEGTPDFANSNLWDFYKKQKEKKKKSSSRKTEKLAQVETPVNVDNTLKEIGKTTKRSDVEIITEKTPSSSSQSPGSLNFILENC